MSTPPSGKNVVRGSAASGTGPVMVAPTTRMSAMKPAALLATARKPATVASASSSMPVDVQSTRSADSSPACPAGTARSVHSTLTDAHFVGAQGLVMLPVDAALPGQVRVRVGGRLVDRPAFVTADEAALAIDTAVLVYGVRDDGSLLVTRSPDATRALPSD